MLKFLKQWAKWLYQFLSSRVLALSLFIILCLVLAVTTFLERTEPFLYVVVIPLLVVLCVNLLICTLGKLRALPVSVLIIHIGVIMTLLGGGIGTSGFVATVNIYEGAITDKFYRWDIEEDINIGVELMVKKLHEEYYPVALKVGVLKGEEKAGLFILKTRESFKIDNYRIRADELDVLSNNLKLSVFDNKEHIGFADTSGADNLPDDFPFKFKLVAYGKNPVLKRGWADLILVKGTEVVAEGTTEVNSPLKWNNLNFHLTSTGQDSEGRTFIGIQITKDPGVPYVYTGFGVISVGCMFYFRKKLRSLRK